MIDALLLDSGVWVASMSSDDQFEPAARELVADLHRRFCALDLTLYEVANAIGTKRGRRDEAVFICRAIAQRCAWATVRARDGPKYVAAHSNPKRKPDRLTSIARLLCDLRFPETFDGRA